MRSQFITFALFAVSVFCAARAQAAEGAMKRPAIVGSQTLPFVAESTSEILAATHLVLIEFAEVDEGAWALAATGLQERRLRTKVRVVDVLKGHLSQPRGEMFDFVVHQQREGPWVESDYHGLWSHTQVQKGLRYLVVACAKTTLATELLDAGHVQALLSPELSADVALASLTEKYLALHAAGEPSAETSRGMIALAYVHRSTARQLFARYLWARIVKVAMSHSDTLGALAQLIDDKVTSLELIASLCAAMSEHAVLLEREAPARLAVVQILERVLRTKRTSSLHARLRDADLRRLLAGP